MPVNAYGNDDFATSFFHGAQVGNMLVQQRERAQQLRSQQALQAIHERELSAQADMLIQHAAFYKQEAQRMADQQTTAAAFGAAVDTTFKSKLKDNTDFETGETDYPAAIMQTGAVLSKIDPGLADKWVTTQSRVYGEMRKSESEGKQFTPQVIQPLDTSTGKPAVDPVTGKPLLMATTSKSGATLIEAKKKEGELGAVGKAKASLIEDRIKGLWKQYDAVADDDANRNSKRFKISMQIGDLHKELAGLGGPTGVEAAAAAPTAPAANGKRVLIRNKEGKKFTVPEEQLKEALGQGFEKVEE